MTMKRLQEIREALAFPSVDLGSAELVRELIAEILRAYRKQRLKTLWIASCPMCDHWADEWTYKKENPHPDGLLCKCKAGTLRFSNCDA